MSFNSGAQPMTPPSHINAKMEPEQLPSIFLNGEPVTCVTTFELKQHSYGTTELNLSLYLPPNGKLEYKDGSYYITTNTHVRLSKAQLRKLILDNVDDNLEAVELVNEFKLSEQESK